MKILTLTAREHLLSEYLSKITTNGARVESRDPTNAVITVKHRESWLRSLLIAIAGVIAYITIGGVLFLLAAAVAFMALHRKLIAESLIVRKLIRVDHYGAIQSLKLD